MRTATKPKIGAKKLASAKRPGGKPKIVLGTGKHLAFVSDTLFDEDLKQ